MLGQGVQGMQINPWPRFGFIHPGPELRPTHESPFWWYRSSKANALSCTAWLVKSVLQKGQQALPPVPTPALSSALSLPHSRFSSLSKTSQTSLRR